MKIWSDLSDLSDNVSFYIVGQAMSNQNGGTGGGRQKILEFFAKAQ
jgi:hypothetical protein